MAAANNRIAVTKIIKHVLIILSALRLNFVALDVFFLFLAMTITSGINNKTLSCHKTYAGVSD